MSLADRIAAWKNGLIAHPRFQDFAMGNPFTRPVANRKAAESFDLVAGFVYSQILVAAVETDLLGQVSAGPVSVGAFSERAAMAPAGAERLLRASASVGLLRHRQDGRYGLGEVGAALLANPSVFAMIRHHKVLYSDLSDVTALLRNRTEDTALGQFWAYGLQAGEAAADTYSELMAQTQSLVADEVLRVARLGRSRLLMDVGGGAGMFLQRAGARHQHLGLRLVDLPAVASLAGRRLARAGLDGRLSIIGMDFLAEPLPGGADVATLLRILHDHDDEPALHILRNIRQALDRGGRLVLAEPMAGEPGARRMGEGYFGMYLWAMGRGRPRHRGEIADMLRQAGFTRIRHLRTRSPLLVSAIEAA